MSGYDRQYDAGAEGGPDGVIDATNNYATLTGSAAKVGRAVIAEFKLIDGEEFGNRAWALLHRAQDTPTNRELMRYHTEQAVKWLVDGKLIKDLEITVDDTNIPPGVGMLVSFTDVQTGDTSRLGFLAPWGHVDP